VSNGSFNVHTFRDDEHLSRDANHQSICLIHFLFQKIEKCLELHPYRTKPKIKDDSIRERTVIVNASHQLISLCAGFLFLLSSAMSSQKQKAWAVAGHVQEDQKIKKEPS
jgi:hypothetical protein